MSVGKASILGDGKSTRDPGWSLEGGCCLVLEGGLATWQRGDHGEEAHSLILVGGTRQGRGCVCIQATPLGRQLMPTSSAMEDKVGRNLGIQTPQPSLSIVSQRVEAAAFSVPRSAWPPFARVSVRHVVQQRLAFFGLVSPQAYHAGFRHGPAHDTATTRPHWAPGVRF